jgi:hypothetical protein
VRGVKANLGLELLLDTVDAIPANEYVVVIEICDYEVFILVEIENELLHCGVAISRK